MTTQARTPELEAEAERMRERRRHLARNIRQARILARQLPPNPAGTDFLRRYRRVTTQQGYLYPNPDRAAACQERADHARKSYELLRAAAGEGNEQAATMLEAVKATVDLYAALAQSAPH
ncbi:MULTISPECIES: hypothetical protein [Deinococcus]|uniref:Uncharacterized protein n=2 Tax=Deinococcus TaxID=1298 RepID=A0A7W8GHY4_9DEIO|nr:hypothetical protein [Deinococcus budaensis]MBB5235961.1 hypothetical protein [Deinococcus budaensis]